MRPEQPILIWRALQLHLAGRVVSGGKAIRLGHVLVKVRAQQRRVGPAQPVELPRDQPCKGQRAGRLQVGVVPLPAGKMRVTIRISVCSRFWQPTLTSRQITCLV